MQRSRFFSFMGFRSQPVRDVPFPKGRWPAGRAYSPAARRTASSIDRTSSRAQPKSAKKASAVLSSSARQSARSYTAGRSMRRPSVFTGAAKLHRPDRLVRRFVDDRQADEFARGVGVQPAADNALLCLDRLCAVAEAAALGVCRYGGRRRAIAGKQRFGVVLRNQAEAEAAAFVDRAGVVGVGAPAFQQPHDRVAVGIAVIVSRKAAAVIDKPVRGVPLQICRQLFGAFLPRDEVKGAHARAFAAAAGAGVGFAGKAVRLPALYAAAPPRAVLPRAARGSLPARCKASRPARSGRCGMRMLFPSGHFSHLYGFHQYSRAFRTACCHRFRTAPSFFSLPRRCGDGDMRGRVLLCRRRATAACRTRDARARRRAEASRSRRRPVPA